MRASGGQQESRGQPDVLEFVRKQELDRKQQQIEQQQRKIEQQQREIDRLKQENERLHKELEAALRASACLTFSL